MLAGKVARAPVYPPVCHENLVQLFVVLVARLSVSTSPLNLTPSHPSKALVFKERTSLELGLRAHSCDLSTPAHPLRPPEDD